MQVIHLSGAPRAMGEAFGQTCRDAIRSFLERRVDYAIRQALQYGGRVVDRGDVIAAAARCIPATRAYDPDGYAELSGIAAGADLEVAEVIAMNGLTDLRDVLSWTDPALEPIEAQGGCTAFIAQRDVTAEGGVLVAQTWDLATDNQPFVLAVHRRPDDAPETWALTTAGCLSLIGLNSAGIALGTTNLRTRDARYGVNYLSVIHKALSQSTFDAAVAAVTEAPRAGAHFYMIADGAGRAAAIECSALHAARQDVSAGFFGHTNHCLIPEHVAVEGAAPKPSTLARLDRVGSLLADEAPTLDVAGAKRVLSDRSGGANSINRDDIDGINTNGAVIIAPEQGRLWACHGLPDEAPWVELTAVHPPS